MGTVAVVTDSTSYLADPAALGVTVVPLTVRFGDEETPEPQVDRAAFWARVRAGEAPSTSQPAPGAFLEAFEATGATSVVCVTCTATMSGTHSAATLAAGMADLPVDVVDSGSISGGLGLVVAEVARAAQRGAAHEEVLAVARALAGTVRSTWSSDTSALLASGGRFGGDVPDGVPVFLMAGEVRVLGSARTDEEAVRLQAAAVREDAAVRPTHVTVGGGDAGDLPQRLAAALDGAPGVLGVTLYEIGPVVGAHTGPGSVGVNWLA